MRKCTNCGKAFFIDDVEKCAFCGTPKQGVNKLEASNKISKTIEESNHPSENTLNSVANFILAVGVISFVVLMFTIVYVESPKRYSSSMEFNPVGFGVAVSTLLTSIVTYSIMKVIRLISINTRKTKEYLEELYKRQQEK